MRGVEDISRSKKYTPACAGTTEDENMKAVSANVCVYVNVYANVNVYV